MRFLVVYYVDRTSFLIGNTLGNTTKDTWTCFTNDDTLIHKENMHVRYNNSANENYYG